MKLAIVIPFFNEEKYIEKTLVSYVPLFRKLPHPFFVLVDNNSIDNTRRIITTFQSQHPEINITLVTEIRKGVHYARKTGLDAAVKLKPDIIISTDADTVLQRDAVGDLLSELIRFFHSRSTVFVGEGSIDPRLYVQRLVYLGEFVMTKRAIWRLYYKIFGPYFFGAFFGLKTEFYRTLIPYYHPERLPGYGEDVVLSRIAYYMGGRFMVSSASFIRTSARRFTNDPVGWIIGERVHDFRVRAPKGAPQLLRTTQTYIHNHKEDVVAMIRKNTSEMTWMFFKETVRFCRETGARSPRAFRAVKNFLTIFNIQSSMFRLEDCSAELRRVHRQYGKNADAIIHRYLRQRTQ